MYLERLNATTLKESPFYRILGNDNDMPNCTEYCFCRAREASGDFNLQIARNSGYGSAKTWFDTTNYPKGSELKTGSIAVFNGTCGHVAFVERVINEHRALISDSRYNKNKSIRDDRYFRTLETDLICGKSTLQGVGNLIGFVYVPINDKRVSRDTGKLQVEITEPYVNARVNPNGAKTGLFIPQGIYNIMQLEDYKGGYRWAKLDDNVWVALGTWTNLYEPTIKYQEDKTDLHKLQDKLARIEAIIHE